MKTQRSGSRPCGNLFRWIRREKILANRGELGEVHVEKNSKNKIEERTKKICERKSRVVLYGVLGLISKNNRPSGQEEGQRKVQLIVVRARGPHNTVRYYRAIPPKRPRTTRILRATALYIPLALRVVDCHTASTSCGPPLSASER